MESCPRTGATAFHQLAHGVAARLGLCVLGIGEARVFRVGQSLIALMTKVPGSGAGSIGAVPRALGMSWPARRRGCWLRRRDQCSPLGIRCGALERLPYHRPPPQDRHRNASHGHGGNFLGLCAAWAERWTFGARCAAPCGAGAGVGATLYRLVAPRRRVPPGSAVIGSSAVRPGCRQHLSKGPRSSRLCARSCEFLPRPAPPWSSAGGRATVQHGRGQWLDTQHLEHDGGGVAGKGFLAGENWYRTTPRRTGRCAHPRAAHELLGRHVGWCAEHGAHLRQFGFFDARNAEVGHLDLPSGGTIRLAGLMSRCTTPWRCAWSSASGCRPSGAASGRPKRSLASKVVAQFLPARTPWQCSQAMGWRACIAASPATMVWSSSATSSP